MAYLDDANGGGLSRSVIAHELFQFRSVVDQQQVRLHGTDALRQLVVHLSVGRRPRIVHRIWSKKRNKKRKEKRSHLLTELSSMEVVVDLVDGVLKILGLLKTKQRSNLSVSGTRDCDESKR